MINKILCFPKGSYVERWIKENCRIAIQSELAEAEGYMVVKIHQITSFLIETFVTSGNFHKNLTIS
jgi:hypothetical protein